MAKPEQGVLPNHNGEDLKMATALQKAGRTSRPRKPSVTWTDGEQAKVMALAAQRLRDDPTASKLVAIQEAQRLALPKDRQRTIDEFYKVRTWFKLPPDLEAQFSKDGKRTTPPADSQPSTTHAAAPSHPTPTPNSQHPDKRPPQLVRSGSARKDGRSKVFWKPAEQSILARGAAMAMHQGLTKSRVVALQMAQAELPEERRRHVNSVASLPWFKPEVDRALNEIRKAQAKLDQQQAKEREREERASTQAAEVNFTLNDPEQAAQARAATVAPAVAPQQSAPTPASLISDGLSMSLAGLRSVLVTELAGVFREAMVLAVRGISLGEERETTTMAQERPSPEPEVSATNGHRHNPYGSIDFRREERRPRLKRVVIAGLRVAESQIIEAEFGDKLDLRFYNTDKSKNELQSMLGSCDVALAITDGRISHNHTDMMRARATNRYVPVAGGMMNVRHSLRTIVSGVDLGPLSATH